MKCKVGTRHLCTVQCDPFLSAPDSFSVLPNRPVANAIQISSQEFFRYSRSQDMSFQIRLATDMLQTRASARTHSEISTR